MSDRPRPCSSSTTTRDARHLAAILKRDYRVLRAATGEAALQIMEKEDVDLMLLDVRLPGISGFEVLKIVKENYPYVEVIIISAVNELDTAIEAMRHGAYHYITKDFDHESIRSLVANASERQDLNRQVMRLQRGSGRAERPRVRRRAEPAARATSSSWCRRSRSCRRRC